MNDNLTLASVPPVKPEGDLLRQVQLGVELKARGEKLEILTAERNKVDEKSREFVGVFYGMMMQQMRASLPGNPLFDGGRGEEIFQQRLDNMLGNDMASDNSQIMTRDGYVQEHSNPLADEFAKSFSRGLDRNISALKMQMKVLKNEIDKLGPLPGTEYDKLDELNSATNQQLENLKISAAKRIPVAQGSGKLK